MSSEETRELVDPIESTTSIGLRDRASIELDHLTLLWQKSLQKSELLQKTFATQNPQQNEFSADFAEVRELLQFCAED